MPATRPATTSTAGGEWGPNPLTGSRTLRVGGVPYKVPRESEVKVARRAGVAWVRHAGSTYVYSELGCLAQTDAERRSTRWDLL